MSANLPLDANDEDVQRRGFTRPSLTDNPLPLANAYQALQTAYDNAREGFISRDNIWPQREIEELRSMTEAQRRLFLESRGIIPSLASIPDGIDLPAVDQMIQNAIDSPQALLSERISGLSSQITSAISAPAQAVTGAVSGVTQSISNLVNPGGQVPTDSYGQSLQGPTTQPAPVSAPPPGGTYVPPGIQPNNVNGENPYVYTPIDLYDDRYDFKTGKIIRNGIASGTGGGMGSPSGTGQTVGAPGLSNQQQEAPAGAAGVTPNDTSQSTYDDAILRQARAQAGEENADGSTYDDAILRQARGAGEYSSPTVNNETTARIAQQPDQTVDYSDNTEANTGNWRPPLASRGAIVASRRQTTEDIRNARANGQILTRQRRPDGTYYAAPANDVTNNQRLPQRVRDF